jgi:hypothetical protein
MKQFVVNTTRAKHSGGSIFYLPNRSIHAQTAEDALTKIGARLIHRSSLENCDLITALGHSDGEAFISYWIEETK